MEANEPASPEPEDTTNLDAESKFDPIPYPTKIPIPNLTPNHPQLTTTPPQMITGLRTPITTGSKCLNPFELFRSALIWCRLPGCNSSSTPFKACKIHSLCTWCGHVIAMPSEHLSEEGIKVITDSHRTERFTGASKKMMEARKTASRFEILGRDNSHFAVPE
ncbi:unnamed protein product [Anisakis simplex]|uniref:Uncharacterized protein n=1 Tax=Anisakis simplex TaxID=6269 RepID=A0A0M3JUJ3_ANISI|nr:unnamed protein product [Anisakis simplex]